MITYKQGSLFHSGAEALVNPVNTKGIMGKGLALEFKDRFPENFDRYHEQCTESLFRPGDIFPVQDSHSGTWIINFATKDDWRQPSQLSWIDHGLYHLGNFLVNHRNITSIAIPALGCGLGGLSWESVDPLIDKYLGHISTQCFVYPPQ